MSSSTESASDRAAGADVAQGVADPRRWWALVAVSLATFMTYMDLNIVSIALPTIQNDLKLSVSGLEWVVSSYLLTLAGLLLVGGRLADTYGRRLLFLVGLAVFTASSLAAGLAGSGGMLVASRAVQGVGAALLTPATLAIIMTTFTDLKERTSALGLWTMSSAMGLALGPVAGGLISQNIRWGWIFLINVPVGLVTLAISARAIRESKVPAATRSLDVPGLVTSAVCLFALTFALIEGNDKGWTSGLIIASFVVSAVAAATFLAVEARTTNPMVDLKIFRIRQFSGGIGTTVIWAFAALGIYFFTALYIQRILGFSPTKAGLLFIPMAFALAACAGLSGLLEGRIGGHRTVAVGMAVMAAGMLVIIRFGLHASFASLVPGIILIGAGMGLLTVPLTNSVMQATPDARAGIASALLNDARELAGLLGITVIGAVLRASQGAALRTGASPAQSFVDGYHDGLWVSIGLIAAGVVISYVTLGPGTGPAEADGLTSR